MVGLQMHVAINHVSVIGIPLVAFFLLWGMIRASEELQRASLVAWILLGVFLFVISQTGESAASQIRANDMLERIHEHEELAEVATLGGGLFAVLCALQLAYWKWKQHPWRAGFWGLLGCSLILTVIMVRVAHLGGLIEHASLR